MIAPIFCERSRFWTGASEIFSVSSMRTKGEKFIRKPRAVMRQACAGIQRNLLMLEYILYDRSSRHLTEETDSISGEVAAHISLMSVHIYEILVNLAKERSAWGCLSIFRDGKSLATAFSKLAVLHPDLFREAAETSLTMPSLRARNPHFSCDAEAVIDAINLGGKHHARGLHDNRSRIGALCHLFVAEAVHLIESARLEIQENERRDHEYWTLPNLHGNAPLWWERVIKPSVHREFDKMRKDAHRNPALWQELDKITDRGTHCAKRAALEKYCFNKLTQIARSLGEANPP